MSSYSKPLRLVAAWATLLALLACGGSDTTERSEEEQARSEALRTLEAHLTEGQTYGEGPDAERLAALVRETLAPEDGVAVRIVPGDPRNVVVLVRYRSGGGFEDLRDISVSERNEEIDRIVDAIDGSYGAAEENLAVAIRGSLFYGALGVRQAGQAMQYHTGSVVSLSAIDPILTAAPGVDAAPPALTLGGQVEGTFAAPPAAPPSYRLVVSEETLVVPQVEYVASEEVPLAVICPGAQRPRLCAEDESLEPLEDYSSDALEELADRLDASGRALQYQAYRLAPGTYTLVVVPDCDDENPCASDGSAFTLRAATPGE